MSRHLWASFLAAAVVMTASMALNLRSVRAGDGPATHSSAMPAAKINAGPTGAEMNVYASPLELLLSPGGTRLYVLCMQSNEIRIVDTATGKTAKTIAVGREPRGFALSPAGDRLFVANSWDDTVSVIDTKALMVTATWKVAAEPSSVAADRTGKIIFVANRISNDVAVLSAATGVEQKRLLAGNGASYMTLSADGARLYATHIYPNPGAHRTPPESEITVIDPATARVATRLPLHSIAGVFHIAQSADGRLTVAAHFHPKDLVPLAHVEHGWAFQNSITVFGPDVSSEPGQTVEVPLDELDRYYAYPFGVVISPGKSHIYVTHAGSDCVTVVDVPRLLRFIHGHPASFAQDLSASANYVTARIPVGKNPRGLVISRDGRRLFVANRLDDTISVIDTRTNRVTSTIALDSPKTITALRKGEQAFYTAKYAFQGQFGCSSCHLDSTLDRLTWDLEPDGLGVDIVDNRLLEDIKGTEPYKWNGGNPDIPTECGIRTEKYFWRSENYDNRTLADLAMYVLSIRQRPNRWRLPTGEFTAAQERGKAIFERSLDKFGKPISEANRCVTCHAGPKGTDQKSFDVGTGKPTDRSGLFDTPQLVNIALTAPYLHDGSARTMEEIWTIYNPNDKHGRTNDLAKDELNDLIEYLRTR